MKQWKSANKSGKYRIHKLREPTVQEAALAKRKMSDSGRAKTSEDLKQKKEC
jgi:hypothetical protein